MATESIIIDIQIDEQDVEKRLGEIAKSVNDLKERNKELKKELKDGKGDWAANSAEIARNDAQIKQLTSTQKTLEGQLTLNTVKNKQLEGSLKEQTAVLNILKNSYASLTEEQKKSAAGQDLLKQIEELDKTVKKTDASMGNFQRNVGNYPKVFDISSTSIGKMQQMLKSLAGDASTSGQMMSNVFNNLKGAVINFGKAFITPPVAIIAVILSSIVVVIKKVVDAFKKNDDALTRLQTSMAAFQPILTAIKKLFDLLAIAISYAVEGIVKLIEAMVKLNPVFLTAKAIFPDFINGLEQSKIAAQNLVKAEDELEEKQRQFTVNQAARNAVIARLNKEARDTQNLTAQQRENLLKRADELERKNLADAKAIAAENLRILTERAKQEVDTSDETKNKIAQARAELFRAEQEYYEGTTRLQQRQLAAQKEIADAEKKRIEEAKKQREEAAKAAKDKQNTLKELTRKLEDEILAAMQEGAEKRKEQEKLNTQREIEDLQERLKTDKTLTSESRKKINELIIQLQNNLQIKLKQIDEDTSKEKLQKDIQTEQDRISKLLEITVKGSENEYNLRVQQIELLRKKELSDTTLTEEQKKLINDYYNNQVLEAKKTLLAKKQAIVKKELENEFNLKKLNIDNEAQLANLELEQAISEYNNLINLDETTKRALYESDADYAAAVIASRRKIINAEKKVQEVAQQTVQNQLKSTSEFADAISQIYTNISSDDAKMADFQYALALFKISLDTAAAISAATASAAKGDPYTVAIRIATAVASAVAAMAQATKALEEAKKPKPPAFEQAFEQGGIVGGTSYTGDKMLAKVNSGEMILNKQQQSNLWTIINNQPIVNKNNFDYELLTNSLMKAINNLPTPVLDYKEFTTFQERLTRYKEITTI